MKHISLRTHEVQNILAGRQTRLSRPVKPQPVKREYGPMAGFAGMCEGDHTWFTKSPGVTIVSNKKAGPDNYVEEMCPWRVGDVIACKETYQYIDFMGEDNGYVFKESQNGKDWEENSEGWTWRSPATMPTAACRLWLKIKEIRCERIQDITEEGAKAEGVLYYDDKHLGRRYKDYLADAAGYGHPNHDYPTVGDAVTSFGTLWAANNGVESWQANPWMWVLIFEKTDKPE